MGRVCDAEALVRLRVPLRKAARAGGFAALTSSMLVGFVTRRAIEPRATHDVVRDEWVARWCSAMLRLFAIDVEVVGSGARSSQATRGRLVVSNHRSTIDIALLLRTFGGHIVSRGDLASWPILGPAARAVGTIFVDRGNAKSGADAIRTIRRVLEQRSVISIFPEGTTFKGDEVREFHPGAFIAAQKSGAEVIPVGIAYRTGSGAAFVGEPFLQHLSRMAGSDRTNVVVWIGDPIVGEDGARASELRDRARTEVARLVVKARERVDRT
jgi:1-acyl-sn-glycerol-3-phosphate acyltransferase